MTEPNFWHQKTLEQLNPEEWEALCDGCALCCMHKIEDADTGEVFYLNHPCSLLNTRTRTCRDYENRHTQVPDCAVLTPKTVREYDWLPETCAYRRIAQNRPLPEWHPLLAGIEI
jgi:hypothetical protein